MQKDFVNCIKSDKIKVSVIIPAYNTEKYVGRCLESVLSQTLINIEIIIIDDGSSDNTSKVIEQFLYDKRVIYLKEKNSGPSSARNRGLSLAKGEFISFVDSDDYIDNDFLEKLYNAAVEYEADIAAASIIRGHETFEKWRINYESTKLITDKDEQFNAAKYPEQSYVWNKIYKKTFLDKINFKFGEMSYFEDVTATFSLLVNCRRFLVVSDTNYYYMVNDGKSIVKGKSTQNKENDRYNNQKEVINSIIKLGIKIPKQNYYIKKKEIKYFGFPILKIKENLLKKKELFLLFNIIPVCYMKQSILLETRIFLKRLFSITDVDSHFLIMFLFFKLNIKHKTKVKLPEIMESGLNSPKRNKRIIASLTSYPDRIKSVSKTVKTIMNQTVKADEIVLYLAKSQFGDGEKSLPSELLNLKEFGLTIKWTDDIKSYKKLIPALKDYPEDIIITFDDDIYYENDTIETLYTSHIKHPEEIQANRIWRVKLTKTGIKPLHAMYLVWNSDEYKTPSLYNTIIGCGGVLYPPHCLNDEVFNEDMFKKILPTQDDIWFWGMAALNGTKIRLNKGYSYNNVTVENTQKTSLAKINASNNKGISGQEGFIIITEQYPDIIKNLEDE